MEKDIPHQVVTKYKVSIFGTGYDKVVDINQYNTCKCCGYDSTYLVSRILASAIGKTESVRIAKRIAYLLNKHGLK